MEGGEPACFEPVVVRGDVFDLLDESAIAEAQIVALDINGAAVSPVAISDDNGQYELAIPSTRQEDGTPVPLELTLRADAAGYQTFPSGLRQSLPIDIGSAAAVEGAWAVESPLTSVGLLSLPEGAGTSSIYGTVEQPVDPVGILVVAESSEGVGYTGVANLDGTYRIFNLPPGSYTVRGYAQGVNYQPQTIDLAEAEAEVDLALDSTEAGSVEGTVQIVNAPGGVATSVILAVESTFNEALARGQTVPGLRAPEPGLAASIEGEYVIEGVPAGKYVVLAAFENDRLVRDPDLSIAGTSILHIEVQPGTATVVDGFKITEALEIFGPGAEGAEEVTEPVIFNWKDDSSEDEYHLEVFDAFGELVWETTIPGESGQDPMVQYAGPALESGMYYQFRVTSLKATVPISRTEDLKGVFYTP